MVNQLNLKKVEWQQNSCPSFMESLGLNQSK